MELTYMVRGADGKEYGPATLPQLSGWIQEGRLPAQDEVRRSDMGYWAQAGSFTELKALFGPTVASPSPTGPAPAVAQSDAATLAHLKSGASWFYWIAGLSLINSISAFSGSTWRFIVGLGITQIFDEVGTHFGTGGKGIVLLLDLVAAGIFVLFGVFANKAQSWAFIVGMVLFALDGLIFLLVPDWLGVGFHAFVLYCLFRGFSACRAISKR